MFLCIFQMLDGYEAMEGLYERLAVQHGKAVRDCIFDGLSLPPLGLSRLDKSCYAAVVMMRQSSPFV
jgi:hypothetical protein